MLLEYRCMSMGKRPGLARTDRGVSRPMRAWLTRALEDDAALAELAVAWSSHPAAERRQLASLLFRDVEAEGVDPTRAQALFAAMLALEDERALQSELLSKLHALEPVVAAFIYGDEYLGGAVVARERAPSDWECLLVDWRDERATRVSYTAVSANVPSEVLAMLTSRALRGEGADGGRASGLAASVENQSSEGGHVLLV